MVGSKSSAGGVTSQRSSRSLAVDVSTVSDAPVEPNKLIRRRPALVSSTSLPLRHDTYNIILDGDANSHSSFFATPSVVWLC